MLASHVKIVVYVPETHADLVRTAMGDAGAGQLGNYSHCTFSLKGLGRYRPEAGANPFIGEVGKLEVVPEERIETVCAREKLAGVLAAMREVHPYEEVAYDVCALEAV